MVDAKERTLGVVVPTIGDREELCRLLQSVAAQTIRPQQVRVVVDADDSSLVRRIVADLAEELSGIDTRVLTTGAHRVPGSYLAETGYGVAVNTGLRELDTDLVAFLDDDDEILPSHFEGLMAALDPDRGIRAAYSRVMVVSAAGSRRYFQEGPLPEGAFSPFTLIGSHPVLLPSVVVERSLLDDIGLMDETLDRKADTDMLVRIGKATRFAAVDAATYVYYRYPHGAEVKDRAQIEMGRLITKHQDHMTRRERWILWDALTRSSLDSGQVSLSQQAGSEALRALLGIAPGWLVRLYTGMRGSTIPKRLARLLVGPRRTRSRTEGGG